MHKLFISIIMCIVIATVGWLIFREGTYPVDRSSSLDKMFVIAKGASLNTIINDLSQQHLIRNRAVFYFIVKQKGIETKIQAGDFRLRQSMNAYEIADSLTHGTLDIWVTIPEGFRKEEIAELLSQKLGIPEVEFNDLAKEGTLFPDTYLFPRGADAGQVIAILTSTMNAKYTSVADQIRQKGLSREEATILASMVEREAAGDQDRQEIANIIYKRFRNDWPIQVDATIQYALGYQAGEKLWWTKRLTQEDYQNVKSPYNTYLNKGLPPGPICNPGLDSFQAIAHADENTKNWFYSHDSKGRASFSEKLSDHEIQSEK